MRRSVTTNGLTAPVSIMNFDMGDMRPHILLAPNIDKWPLMDDCITEENKPPTPWYKGLSKHLI